MSSAAGRTITRLLDEALASSGDEPLINLRVILVGVAEMASLGLAAKASARLPPATSDSIPRQRVRRLLTLKEFADELEVSHSTVARMRRRGEIQIEWVGRRPRVPESEVLRRRSDDNPRP
jgi:excisionase family DNA binding protein